MSRPYVGTTRSARPNTRQPPVGRPVVRLSWKAYPILERGLLNSLRRGPATDLPMSCLQRILAIIVVWVPLIAGTGLPAAAETSSFHIGNSITWDSQPLGIEALAELRGGEHAVGHHIFFSSSLDDIWNNPTFTSRAPVEDFGTFEEALPAHHWNAVTMQPWPKAATLGQDAARIIDFIDLTRTNPANQDTEFFIYTPWARFDRIRTHWLNDVAYDDSTRSSTTREYFQLLARRVREDTDAPVFIIPVGEVFYQLDQRIQAGNLPGITSPFQLYRDAIHASYSVGRYVAGVTTYATLFKEDPAGLTAPDGFYTSDSALFTPELYAGIHETVWQVVREHSLLFAGDFNGNGLVEQADLDLVLSNWGTLADPAPEGWLFHLPSGAIDQDELDQVLANWGGPAPPSGLSAVGVVPEPGAWALVVCAALLWGAIALPGDWIRQI